MNLKAVSAVLLLIVVAVISLQNLAPVDVTVFFWTLSVRKIVLVLVVYALGMVSGWGLLELVKKAF